MMHNRLKPVVLAAPLNWGIGHASRIIPVIKIFIEEGFEVLILTSGASGELLKSYFTGLNFIISPSLNLKYGRKHTFLAVIYQLPSFMFYLIKEHFILKKIIKEYGVNVVLSDNRYGLRNKNIYTVLITHQVFVKMPKVLSYTERFLHLITAQMIEKFNECWIPDFPDEPESMSGALSHGKRLPSNCRYIGLLSRFTGTETVNVRLNQNLKLLVILSGPEPQRTILEELISSQINMLKIKAVILRGLPGNTCDKKGSEFITFLNHVADQDFSAFVRSAEFIVCRSGYSTIMDLLILGRNALLVPTPGQTEQEYLAHYLSGKGYFIARPQFSLNLAESLETLAKHKNKKLTSATKGKMLLKTAMNNIKMNIPGR